MGNQNLVKSIERGNKIVLPNSAAQALRDSFAQGPMIFCLTNMITGISTNVGVMEFTAPNGKVYVPRWICELLVT